MPARYKISDQKKRKTSAARRLSLLLERHLSKRKFPLKEKSRRIARFAKQIESLAE
jgi:hypothetical protein